MEKIVIITGGTRGIGLACVKLFAERNYNIIFNYNNNDELAKNIVLEITAKYNVKCSSYKCDIASENDVKKMFEDVSKKYGHIDILVNNAGISSDNELINKSVIEFKRIIDVNLTGTFIMTKYFSQIINKGGSIINVASGDGIDTCYKEEMDYAASKAGVISLTKTLAKELAPNIRVNAVAPGWVNTDMAKKDIQDNELDLEKEIILLKRFAEPFEIANVIFFLASDEASYVNASIIRVDGGY